MTRKVTAIILSLTLLLASIAAIPAFAETISTKIITTNPGDTLYVRKGPHKGNTPTVGTVRNNDKVSLYYSEDEDDPEAWCKIKVQKTGAIGYIKNKYVKYFGFDNSDGELNKHEDSSYDYSDASDNDGRRGSSSSSSSSSSSKVTFGLIATKSGGTVNVRKSASTSSASIAKVYDGDRVDILGTSGSWYRVKTSKGVTGYVYGDYVSKGIGGYTTARSGLNLRKSASSSAAVLKTIPYDKYVTVYSKSGNWLYVKYSGTYGYISASYCQY